MKKILSLLALLMLCIVGANAETVAKYALSVDDTFTSGQTVEVKNGDAVVATITYGETGGADFKAAKSYTGIEGYTAFTEGNGVNGNKEGGTFYTITPKIDATISVAVCLNADKAFYIEEDGTALEDYNGITVSAKFYGTYEFEATADKAYKVYCAGSKLGFFGFEVITPDVYTVAGNAQFLGEWEILEANDLVKGEDGIYTKTFEGVELENDYVVEYKIVKNHSWDESYGDNGNNANYKVWEGNGLYDVTFTFNAETKAVSCTMTKQAVDLTEYKNALQTLISQVEAFGLSLLAADVAAAKEALNDPNATAESLTEAANTFKANVIAKLDEALDLAAQFGEQFGYDEISGLVPTAKTMVEAWNMTMLKMLMPQLAQQAMAKVKDALSKIAPYAETMDNEALTAALAAAEEAADGTDYILALQKIEEAVNVFLAASQEFVAKVQAINDKTEELEAALAAAMAALGAEKPNIVDIGVAIQNLVKAYRDYEEAQQIVIESMTIVGDFLGFETEEENFNPANGWPMIQDADNPAIWTLTKENVVVEAKQYNYKATANGVYGVYELPAQGNHNWVFGSDEYPAGTYNLTFTADTEKHDLTLVVDKQAEATEFLILTLDGRADITEGKALLVEATEEVSANIWIKKEAAGARGIAKVPAAEIMEDGIAMLLIEDADLTSGQFSIYADKQFEIAKVTLLPNPDAATGEQIYPVVEPVDPFELVKITPAEGEVESLQEFELDFSAYENVQTFWGDPSLNPYIVITGTEDKVAEGLLGDVYEGKIPVTFTDAITEPGSYTLIIPALTIQVDGVDNVELGFKYTIKDADAADYTIDPEGVVQESLGTFTITFNNFNIEQYNYDAVATLKNETTGTEKTAEIMIVGMNKVYLSFEETTEAGSYTLTIPARALANSLTGQPLDYELSFSYRIEGGVAQDFTIDPAPGEVESLETFTIDFTYYIDATDATAYLFNAETEAEIAASVVEVGGNKLIVTLAEAVTTPGEWQLNVEGVKKMADETPVELIFDYIVKSAEPDMNYYIVGDFFGWDNLKQMEPTDVENVYQLVIDFTAEAKTYYYKMRQGSDLSNWDVYQLPAEGNQDFEFGTEMYPAGDYTLTFTANVAEHKLTLDVVKKDVALNPFENVTIDPAEGEVASLQEFTITFANAENAYGAYFDEADMPYLVNADNTQVFYGEFGYGFDGYNQVTVTLSEEVTLAGEYTLVIPAGTITADDATNTEALTFSYTIAEGEKEFSVYVVNVPEDFGTARPFAYVWSGEGDNVTEFAGAWPGTRMGYSEDVPGYSDMGFIWQITAKVAPEFIVFSNGKNSTDEGAKQTKDLEFVPNKVYDLTELLATSTGINAVNAAIANGAVIYNLQGVRVEKAYKGGLYIVNGKKVVMK